MVTPTASKAVAEIAIGLRQIILPERSYENICWVRSGGKCNGRFARSNCSRRHQSVVRFIPEIEILHYSPSQHVLESLSGYLLSDTFVEKLPIKWGSFHFYSNPQEHKSVSALVEAMSKHWGCASWEAISEAYSQLTRLVIEVKL